MYAIRSYYEAKTLPALVKHLKDPAAAVRVHTAEALGNFSDRRLIPYLAAVLSADDAELVVSAISSLGAIGAAEAEPHLLPLLRDSRSAIRQAAAEALGRLHL